MRISKGALPPKKFRKLAERISKSVNLKGCESEKDIKNKLREMIKRYEDRYVSTPPAFKKHRAEYRSKAKRWRGLLKSGFAFRLLLEAWNNPHPVYRKILDMDDFDYNMYLDEKKEAIREKIKYYYVYQ